MKINFQDHKIDNYILKRRLGTGGYADVWLAHEMGPDYGSREVAIKIFLEDESAGGSIKKAFDNFIRDLSTMRSLSADLPIVMYYNVVTSSIVVNGKGDPITASHFSAKDTRSIALYLIVMEFADGGALGDEYTRSVVWSARDVSHLDHFIDICHALEKMALLSF